MDESVSKSTLRWKKRPNVSQTVQIGFPYKMIIFVRIKSKDHGHEIDHQIKQAGN